METPIGIVSVLKELNRHFNQPGKINLSGGSEGARAERTLPPSHVSKNAETAFAQGKKGGASNGAHSEQAKSCESREARVSGPAAFSTTVTVPLALSVEYERDSDEAPEIIHIGLGPVKLLQVMSDLEIATVVEALEAQISEAGKLNCFSDKIRDVAIKLEGKSALQIAQILTALQLGWRLSK